MLRLLSGKQEQTLDELEHEDDPRGGLQSKKYRTADPRDLIEEEGVIMAAPGGAPQEGESPEGRRRRDRE